jgi:hypothetical protein
MTDTSLTRAAVVAREALFGWPLNYCAALDADGPFCYIPSVIGPARMSAGRLATRNHYAIP